MNVLGIYLDNAATTPLSSEMKSYLSSILDIYGNPSSAHSIGVEANRLIERVREETARFIGADNDSSVYFTSSASASNTLGIQGFALLNRCEILYPETLHKSALKTIENLNKYYDIETHILAVDNCGNIILDCLRWAMQTGVWRKLVVIDYASSEIGTIQDIAEISKIVHQYHGVLFVDCTGSISSIPLDVGDLKIDIASFSPHKIGGLKGVGVLYTKDDALAPLVFGSQERGLFAGTENTLGILSLGKAIDLMDYNKTSENRDFVWHKIKDIKDTYLIGAPLEENRLLNNLNICIKGIKGSDIVALLDDIYKTQVSTGSACNNGSSSPSPTLSAIGVDKEDVYSCIRISFSGKETKEDLQEFCENLSTVINMLRNNV